jgi:vancomycin resistance protein YoaR
MVRHASQSLSGATTTEIGTETAVDEHATKRRLRFAASPPRFVIAILIGIGAVFFAMVIATFAERRIYDGRVLRGVQVAGVDAAGESETEVRDAVARLGAQLSRSPVRVRIDGHELSADPSLLALTVDAAATARAAMNEGREGTFLAQLIGTPRRWLGSEAVSLSVVYDDDRLEGMLDGWSAETDDPAVEGGLRFEGTRVIPIVPHAGTGILRPEARAALVRMLASPDREVLTLPVGTIYPQVDPAAVDAAATRARALLRGDVTIVTGKSPITITPGQLATAMGTRIIGDVLTLTVDPERLHDAIGPVLAAQEQPPVDATFAVTEENTVEVVPSRNGRLIDMRAVAAAILSGQRRIPAPLENAAPEHDTKWARSLGIKGQVSAYTTEYPSGEARVTNIHRGADLLNNTVVEPGRVFSLNDTIGPRTAERGFVTAPVFAEGAFFDDFGGGVSQLATTVYNASFFGGYEDVTHQPHTIYISRYPAGREATVNYGAIDLQFRNDTEHGVLIRTYYSETSVTVAFYGDNDGRSVREENRAETNPVPVTDELIECPASPKVDPYAICASLSAGETERIGTGDPGLDVAFDRVIDQPGKPQRREHYTWHYTMLPNRILVGTNPAASSTTTTTRPPADKPKPTTTAPPTTRPKGPPTSGNTPR